MTKPTKLYAIVDDGNMDGDSAYYVPDSCVAYTEGMKLPEIRTAYVDKLVKDGWGEPDSEEIQEYARDIRIAWVVTSSQLNVINRSSRDCGNDSAVYQQNRTLKHVTAALAIKTIGRLRKGAS